jgi:ATP-dependent RNA helicase RhlE
LAEPILRAVVSEGYTMATPVQAEAIPHILRGRDLLGSAQTGTGKTAAFALPILHRLSIVARPGGVAKPRCLVLCPTRELAAQIAESFRVYGKHVPLKHAVVYGGVGIHGQAQMLRRGVDILIATPGRLLDLLNQGYVDLKSVEVLVLDEADRMLDMGFIPDIRRIIAALPSRKQTLLFSATMPNDIRRLAASILRDPITVQVAHDAPAADRIDQSVYLVARANKSTLLSHLVRELPMTRAIVFTRTKRGADRVVDRLSSAGIRSEAIHGNKSQNARQRALDSFRSGKIAVLVATDVASRGIDVDGITHVVNYDVTDEPETYVHRIGRTARAGASGQAVTLCDPDERGDLRAIERFIGMQLPVKTNQPSYVGVPASAAPRPMTQQPRHHAPKPPQFSGPRPVAPRPAAPAARRAPHSAAPRTNHPLHGNRHPQGRGASKSGFRSL